MPRLRNERTGVVVNVDDATATQLRAGSDKWTEGDKPEAKKAPAKKAAASRKSSS